MVGTGYAHALAISHLTRISFCFRCLGELKGWRGDGDQPNVLGDKKGHICLELHLAVQIFQMQFSTTLCGKLLMNINFGRFFVFFVCKLKILRHGVEQKCRLLTMILHKNRFPWRQKIPWWKIIQNKKTSKNWRWTISELPFSPLFCLTLRFRWKYGTTGVEPVRWGVGS